jgi:hypothetical protein
MPMPEQERRRYNRDCAAIDRLQDAAKLARGDERSEAVEQLKTAWVAFDRRWNERTPTEDQMARWMLAIGI